MSEYLCRQLYWKRIFKLAFTMRTYNAIEKRRNRWKNVDKERQKGWKGQRRQCRSERSKEGQDAEEDVWGEDSSWKVGWPSLREAPLEGVCGWGAPSWARGLKVTHVRTIKVHEPCTFKYLLKIWALKTLSSISSASQVHFYSIWRETFLQG